jgi:hypothetical protein
MCIDETLDHSALSISDRSHVDTEPIDTNSKFLAAPDVVRELRGMDDVLARQARDVWTGAADILPLYNRHTPSATTECPGKELSSGSAAKNEEIIILGLSMIRHDVLLSSAALSCVHPPIKFL